MSILKDKNILLGVTAGIAAYKAASLVRLFVKAGANVQVIMTPSAKDFVTPLTLSTLSKNEVYSSFVDENKDNPLWINHVDLGLWADVFVIAPATANTMAKMANGVCDNLVLATYLSAKCPVYIAPAMDLDMYKHPATKSSINTLMSNGNKIIPVGTGELASGLMGEGRMAEPEVILDFLVNDILEQLPLRHKKVLITAGPTYEAIDPVRFIGNHSSGKMGFALAEAAANLGAEVVLISGPTPQTLNHSLVKVIPVVSASDMYGAVHEYYTFSDIVILSAAVADYTPINVATQKIKKADSTFHITLTKTKDILKSLGDLKTTQFLVGFALETNDEIENAKSKVSSKNLNLIVLNSLQDKGAGFGGDTNKVTLIDASHNIIEYPLKSKSEVATDIMTYILKQIHA